MQVSEIEEQANTTGLEIAVIGMAGRFPGARTIDEFWENLRNGVESLSFSADEELEEAGVDPELIKNPHYVRAKGGVLEDKELFDAGLFGYTPLEAEVMDPQVRILHECVWEALENAGCDSQTYDGLIGLYAGAAANFYWKAMTVTSGKGDQLGPFASGHLTEREFLTTRVSYKLDLKGPSFTVLTACSTSLVAIHLACQGILNGECDMALAGGVRVESHTPPGYLFHEGLIRSPDGHCRAFDAKAGGTIHGNGVGIVVLKALEDARRDRDYIHAVIKGTAINNDGLRKGGYSAPSIEGQCEVIDAALQVAAIEPESIGYVETHGTGTILGDPIEIEALKLAFDTDKRNYCAIGAVKTNIGHLEAAAGAAGFIKTVLALKHRLILPSLHFETPNPKIDFQHSPFYVNTSLSPWKGNHYPLRAGVSSFGIGGTNAHVILEEAPGIPKKEACTSSRKYQLIVLSAKTKSSLSRAAEKLGGYLEENPSIDLADAAYTLQVGRRALSHREIVVCSDINEAVRALSPGSSADVKSFIAPGEDRPVVFMFPGQGAQYVNMGLELYQAENIFREEMDRCFEITNPMMGYDLKNVLYPYPDRGQEDIHRTAVTQPLLFIFEYALAKLLTAWGIKPDAMIGHSIGEYTAACLSGVFSLEDALGIVILRGKLMEAMPAGSMLTVNLAPGELKPLLDEELSLAAVNGISRCTVSGAHKAVGDFEKRLTGKGIQCRRLHTSHAFHSKMMDPVTKEFEEGVRRFTLHTPEIPYISNVSGTWITVQDAVSARYWARHLRQTVLFSDGIGELAKMDGAIFVEIGPGRVLSSLVNQHPDKKTDQMVLNLVKHPQENTSDREYLTGKLGMLWLYGKTIDWQEYHRGEERYRIPLPTYSFDWKHYWIEENFSKPGTEGPYPAAGFGKRKPIEDWFYVPQWRRSFIPPESICIPTPSHWLVFMDESSLSTQLVRQLQKHSRSVITVRPGSSYQRINPFEYVINHQKVGDYDRLFKELVGSGNVPAKIVHMWGLIENNDGRVKPGEPGETQDLGLYSLIHTAQTIGSNSIASNIQVNVVTNNIQDVTGEENLYPEKATILGPVKVIPLEYSNISCRCIDIVHPGSDIQRLKTVLGNLLDEFFLDFSGTETIAYRGVYRWLPAFEPVKLDANAGKPKRLREKGVYLITGGLGGMGFAIAQSLAQRVKAGLILIDIEDFPPGEQWDDWLVAHNNGDEISRKIRRIRELEKSGARFHIHQVNVSDSSRMKEVISQSENQLGEINGIIHTAGLIDYAGVIQKRTREMTEELLEAKVRGTLVLEQILDGRILDFIVLFSSLGNILYKVKFGQVGYNAGHEFLDVFAYYKQKKGTFAVTIDWNDWLEVGIAAKASNQRGTRETQNSDELAISPLEGVEVFYRILDSHLPRAAVSTHDLNGLIEYMERAGSEAPEWVGESDEGETLETSAAFYERPELSTPYISPGNDTEKRLADIWRKFFGIKKVGIRDNFFELGGDSLKAMSLTSVLHKEFDAEVPLAEIFNRPVVEELAEFIDNLKKDVYTSIEPLEEKEYYELSSAQKRLFFLHQLEDIGSSYNMPFMLSIKGKLDMNHLENALKISLKRHDILRASFLMINNLPFQRIHRHIDFKLREKIPGNRTIKEIINEFIQPFDLSKPPLWRVVLYSVMEEEYLLLFDMHHIIGDGTSMGIFIDEVTKLYAGEELPPLKIQYKDFSTWQNNLIRIGKVEEQKKFWLDLFSGEIPTLNLPTDFPRPAIFNYEGNVHRFKLDPEDTLPFKEIISGQGATLYMGLLAVFNILLYKYTAQNDIIVGTGIVGRPHADLQGIIGMFVNTLALRNYPDESKGFLDFLKEVKEICLKAFENQDLQFEELVDELIQERDPSRNPLFDVLFVVQNFYWPKVKVEEVTFLPYEFEGTTSKFDFTLFAFDQGNEINFGLEYAAALFKSETIKKMSNRFIEILKQVKTNPDIKIGDITISRDSVDVRANVSHKDFMDFDF